MFYFSEDDKKDLEQVSDVFQDIERTNNGFFFPIVSRSTSDGPENETEREKAERRERSVFSSPPDIQTKQSFLVGASLITVVEAERA